MNVEVTRDRIIGAALELVASQGLGAVTMVAVARTAGVARATLYNHYPDVPSILADAATRHNDEAIAGLRQALTVAGSPTEILEQLVRYVAAISTHGHSLRTHHGFPDELRDPLAAFDHELDLQIRRALSDGRAAGVFSAELDLPVTTRLVRHMLNGLSELVAESPDEAARLAGLASATIFAALADRSTP